MFTVYFNNHHQSHSYSVKYLASKYISFQTLDLISKVVDLLNGYLSGLSSLSKSTGKSILCLVHGRCHRRFSVTRPARSLLLVTAAQATHTNVAMDLSICFITVLAVRKLQTVVKHSFKLTVTTTKSRSEIFSKTNETLPP